MTTLESLWMGVPVISLRGRLFSGRHGVSHLSNVGLADWIADDEDRYVALAVDWAGRIEELAEVRMGLRARMGDAPICDAAKFTRDLENVFHGIWETFRDRQ